MWISMDRWMGVLLKRYILMLNCCPGAEQSAPQWLVGHILKTLVYLSIAVCGHVWMARHTTHSLRTHKSSGLIEDLFFPTLPCSDLGRTCADFPWGKRQRLWNSPANFISLAKLMVENQVVLAQLITLWKLLWPRGWVGFSQSIEAQPRSCSADIRGTQYTLKELFLQQPKNSLKHKPKTVHVIVL